MVELFRGVKMVGWRPVVGLHFLLWQLEVAETVVGAFRWHKGCFCGLRGFVMMLCVLGCFVIVVALRFGLWVEVF
jgi:hypothetical protein